MVNKKYPSLLICAKFCANLINTSKIAGRKTNDYVFLAYPVGYIYVSELCADHKKNDITILIKYY